MATSDRRLGTSPPPIELADVTFGYSSAPVVEDVSLTVESGEYVGLVGPNGSGKSTLLRVALGLESPDSGSARLFGERAVDFRDGTRVGYVAQDAGAAKRMPITVREVVRMGRFPHVGFGFVGERDRRAIDEALETVGVADLADRRITALSGGQRQRAFIARALAARAELLVLDEPTVGIDAESRAGFYDLLSRLNREGLTIVLVEHDLGVVTEAASRIVCMNRELLFDGSPDSFVESGALAEAFGVDVAFRGGVEA